MAAKNALAQESLQSFMFESSMFEESMLAMQRGREIIEKSLKLAHIREKHVAPTRRYDESDRRGDWETWEMCCTGDRYWLRLCGRHGAIFIKFG